MGAEPDRQAGRAVADVAYGRLVLGGAGVGAVVFGLGSRVAMRVVGLIASPERLGESTAFGVVGDVTVNGVVELVVFGALAGLFSGLLYLAVRPWLPGSWAVRGLTFGLLLLSPVGIVIAVSSKSDFGLASLTVIYSLFGGMIVLEGLATAWLIERLGRSSLPPTRPSPLGYMVLGAIALLGFVALGSSLSDIGP